MKPASQSFLFFVPGKVVRNLSRTIVNAEKLNNNKEMNASR